MREGHGAGLRRGNQCEERGAMAEGGQSLQAPVDHMLAVSTQLYHA